MESYKKERQRKVQTHQKVFARIMAKEFLRDAKMHAMECVSGQGYCQDPLDERVLRELLPGFYAETMREASYTSRWREQAAGTHGLTQKFTKQAWSR